MLYVGPASNGPRMECPMYLPVGSGSQSLLMASAPDTGKSYYAVGSEAAGVFTPVTEGIVDHGAAYAAKVLARVCGWCDVFGV